MDQSVELTAGSRKLAIERLRDFAARAVEAAPACEDAVLSSRSRPFVSRRLLCGAFGRRFLCATAPSKQSGGAGRRRKGDWAEREIVALHQALGIKAERYPLSGASRFRGSGHDVAWRQMASSTGRTVHALQ
jgi:hypothetical protein